MNDTLFCEIGIFGIVFNAAGLGTKRREVLIKGFFLPPASVKAQIIMKGISRIGTSSIEVFKVTKDRLISETQPEICSNIEAKIVDYEARRRS